MLCSTLFNLTHCYRTNLAKATLNNWVKNLKARKADELKLHEHTVDLRKANAAITRGVLEKQQIQHAKALADAQSEAKSVFLHHMSHEMSNYSYRKSVLT